jgi:hypothetical protein
MVRVCVNLKCRYDTYLVFSQFPSQEFRFNCVGPKGAIWVLLHGAHMQRLRNLDSVQRYAIEHAHSRYKYINGVRGCELWNGSLYLITGCKKLQSWGIALFKDISPQQEFNLSFKPTSGDRYPWEGDIAHFKIHLSLALMNLWSGTRPHLSKDSRSHSV